MAHPPLSKPAAQQRKRGPAIADVLSHRLPELRAVPHRVLETLRGPLLGLPLRPGPGPHAHAEERLWLGPRGLSEPCLRPVFQRQTRHVCTYPKGKSWKIHGGGKKKHGKPWKIQGKYLMFHPRQA